MSRIREVPLDTITEQDILNHTLTEGSLLISPDDVYNKLRIVNRISYSVLIDIRDEISFKEGHVVGSVNFDVTCGNVFERFEMLFEMIRSDVEKPKILFGNDYDPEWFPVVLLDDNEVQPSLFNQGVIDLFMGYTPAIRSGVRCIKVLDKGFSHFFRCFPSLCTADLCEMNLDRSDSNSYQYPSCIIPGFLYLGGEKSVSLIPLRETKIKKVLNMAIECENPEIPGIEFLNIQIEDTPKENIFRHFEEAIELLEQARLNGQRVLVHCQAGVSRSATIIIAYLMQHNQWTLEEALNYTKSKRPIIHPNIGFKNQLVQFQKTLFR
eukprot:TRINITY_DN7129_c0_g1_i1.p1 TRINITY_DN7129_c0_g1~~TRINITY_DN7129_c0_g1_i1.p1  ORF type:complete len:340 (-),score=49.33 TRINITY_DN7129_c0_g1_i1:80-1048(-)